MLGQNGFGDDCPETARLSEANNGCDEMDDENEQIAHNSSYSGQNPLQFHAKLEFARHSYFLADFLLGSSNQLGRITNLRGIMPRSDEGSQLSESQFKQSTKTVSIDTRAIPHAW
jgi:hypothetical protein